MFDTMTLTKAAGAVIAAALVFLLGSWAADALYTPGGAGRPQAYAIDTGAEELGEDLVVVEQGPGFAELYAAADPGAGERAFGKCRACHNLAGTNATGPHLVGLVDRPVAGVDGYAYSEALIAFGGSWTPEELDAYLTDPRGYIPGNKMAFAGLPRATERADLIAYLATVN